MIEKILLGQVRKALDLGHRSLIYGLEIHWLENNGDGIGNINYFEVAFSGNGTRFGRSIRLTSIDSQKEIYYVDEP